LFLFSPFTVRERDLTSAATTDLLLLVVLDGGHLGVQRLDLGLDLLSLGGKCRLVDAFVLFNPLETVVDDGLEFFLFVIVQLSECGASLEGFTDGVAVVFQFLSGLGLVLERLVLGGKLSGFLNHTIDFVLGETTLIVLDGDVVLLGTSLVLGGDVQDSICVQSVGDFDLRHTTGGGEDTIKVELTEQVIVLALVSLTLVDADLDTSLVVIVGGEHVGLLARDGGVTLDNLGEDVTDQLQTEGQRGDIEQQHVLARFTSITVEDGGLDGGTVGDSLIGVDGSARLLTVEEILDQFLHLGDTSGTTDKHDFGDVLLVDLGGLECGFDGEHGSLEVVEAEFFKLGTGESAGEVDTVHKGVDFDRGRGVAGQGTLGTFTLGAETTEGLVVTGQVGATVLTRELLDAVVHNSVIEIFTTQVGITGDTDDLEDTTLNLEERDIEGTSTHIVDEDLLNLVGLLVQTVRDGGGGRFVDDTEGVQTGNVGGVLGGLSLRVVEVGGDRDDGVGDGLSEVGVGDFLHFSQHHGGDLFGVEGSVLVVQGNLDLRLVGVVTSDLERPQFHVGLHVLIVYVTTDQTLGIEHGVLGVAGSLVLGGITNQSLTTVGGESHVGGGGSVTLVVGNDFDLVVLPHTDTRVGGTQIDTDSVVFSGSHLLLESYDYSTIQIYL